MNLFFALIRIFSLFIAIFFAVNLNALTLGTLRGSALLGQPLQVSVPVQFGVGEDSSASCFQADVFYGEVHQNVQGVSFRTESSDSRQASLVSIHSASLINEPVVAVTLRAVCGQRTSRRYVLLVDLPTETAAISSSQPSPADQTAKLASDASNLRTGLPKQAPRFGAQEPVRSFPERKASSDTRAVKTQSHLKLAPWELGPEMGLILKSSDSLLFLGPLENLQRRAEAIAIWRALNTTPEDVLRQNARIQTAQEDLKALTDLKDRNQQSLADITLHLQNSELKRYANPSVYVLVLLLLVLATVIAMLWRRLRDASAVSALVSLDARATPSLLMPQAETLAASEEAILPAPRSDEIDSEASARAGFIGVNPVPAAIHAVPLPPVERPPEFIDFGNSNFGALQAINTREMLDIRLQADFFMTLGRYEKAITVLTEGIASSDSVNPLVYLDLLKIFHVLSRREDYDRYREKFNQEFMGLVPVYVGFNQGSKSLEAYPDILNRIERLWPTREACEPYIESCLVRNPADTQETGLDLEAYCELLMLYGILRRLDSAAEAPMAPFSALRPIPAAAA